MVEHSPEKTRNICRDGPDQLGQLLPQSATDIGGNEEDQDQGIWGVEYHEKVFPLQTEGLTREEQQERFQKLDNLLENWCDPLRKAVLSRDSFR